MTVAPIVSTTPNIGLSADATVVGLPVAIPTDDPTINTLTPKAADDDVDDLDDDDDDLDDDDSFGDDDDGLDGDEGFNDGLDDDDELDEFDDIDEDDFDDGFDDDFEEELEDDYEIAIDDEISDEFGLSTGPPKDENEDDDLGDFEDFDNLHR